MARSALLALAAVLLAGGRLGAAVPPDLIDSSRQLEQFPASKGQGSESERLKRFFDLHWLAKLRGYPEYATYIGVPGFEDRLSDNSPETFDLSRRITRQELAALDSIDRARLTPAEQLNYDLVHWRLEQAIEGERFHPEYLAVHQLSSVHADVVYLLGAMPARNAQDFVNRLARMRAFPLAVDQTLALLEKGLQAGITSPRITLRDVPGQIDALLTADPMKSAFLASFQQMPEAMIPAAERERLRREAVQVFEQQVAPALRKLREYLVKTYIPGARETTAMSDLPDGRAWYAYNVKTGTTTDLTPEQIHQLGLSEVKRIRGEMDALIATTGFKGSFAEFCHFLRTDPRFFYDKPEELIAGYRDITKRIDPELIKLFGRLPRLPYGVVAVPDYDAKSQTTAYYGNGSLAAGRPGWFHVNTYDLKSRPKWEMEDLALHEAVPGHHIMYSLNEELGELPAWRQWDVYPAMSEGWALYAESLGSELGLYKDPYSKFGQLSAEIWRAIRLVVDTGLHTKGWTRQQAIDYAKANSAKPEHDVEVEIDRYMVWPGGAVVYKIGELKIKELRAYAQKELGPKFDIRAFHDHVLGNGQLPLALLEKQIKEWVASEKAKVAGLPPAQGAAAPSQAP
ncbi:MAG TPA: DUF885 domain-containing protein [Thermoanaerobaculia bacterium]|nr:DUF885 domain-containing protein [Thermoanaerobaculia bacterium]